MKKLLLLLPVTLNAITQSKCLDLIEKEAEKHTRHKTTIMAEAMQETSCGVHLVGDLQKNILDSSLGVLQFRLKTARETIGWIDELKHLLGYTDQRLATELLTNHKLSTQLACVRFERYRKAYGYKKAVQAHNGLHGNFRYYNKVMRWKKWILKRKKTKNVLK